MNASRSLIALSLFLFFATTLKSEETNVLDHRIPKFSIDKGSTGDEVLAALLEVLRPERDIYSKLEIHERPIRSEGQKIRVNLRVSDVTLKLLLEMITTHMHWTYRVGISEEDKKIHTIHIYRWHG